MNMNAQAEEKVLAQRLHAARVARLSAQRMRLLAAERAEKLERELKKAAESGLRAEISRTLDARGRLQVLVKRKSAARYSGIAAFGLLLGVASLGMGWAPSQNAAVPGHSALQSPVLVAAPGDRLKLAYSYSVSPPAAR
jgi:hypothetical protein